MKQWQTPKLIVLSRGGPQESVLNGCKAMTPYALLSALTMAGGIGCGFVETPAECTMCNTYQQS